MRVLASLLLLAGLGGGGVMAGSALRSWSGDVEAEPGAAPVERVPPEAGHSTGGGPGAPVLRIFADYECPACASLERAAGEALRALAARGRIRFVYHHAPLRSHRRGPLAAAIAYCAVDAGAGWAVHRALYESAADWGTAPAGEQHLLGVFAPLVGDTAVLRECVRGGSATRRVAADREAAEALGVREVPAIFLDDRRLRVGSWRGLVRYVAKRARAP